MKIPKGWRRLRKGTKGGNVIVAVGERVLDREMDEGRVWAWNRAWSKDPLRLILRTPAMATSSSLKRLARMLGYLPTKTVNLLPPSPEPGAWDAGFAGKCAGSLLDWAEDEGHSLILLGRRVGRACSKGAGYSRFGTMIDFCRVQALVMPHPSGSNRLLNDSGFRDYLRRRAAAFAGLGPLTMEVLGHGR